MTQDIVSHIREANRYAAERCMEARDAPPNGPVNAKLTCALRYVDARAPELNEELLAAYNLVFKELEGHLSDLGHDKHADALDRLAMMTDALSILLSSPPMSEQ